MSNRDSGRNRMLPALVALVFLAIGFGLGQILDSPGAAPGAEAPPKDEAGGADFEIVDAAARYLLAQNACANGIDACLSVMQDIAAPRWMPNAEQQAREGVDFLRAEYGSDARIQGAILSYRVSALDHDSGEVSFWAVSVFSSPSRGPDAVWAISELTLELISDRWLVVAQGSTPGPTPETIGEAGSTSVSELQGFREYVPASSRNE